MNADNPIYIQEASVEEFQQIPKIGKAKAGKLVMLREVQGFLDLADLIKCTGIVQEDWEKLITEGIVVIKGLSSKKREAKLLSEKINQLELDRVQLNAESQRLNENNQILKRQMEEKDRIWQERLQDYKSMKESQPLQLKSETTTQSDTDSLYRVSGSKYESPLYDSRSTCQPARELSVPASSMDSYNFSRPMPSMVSSVFSAHKSNSEYYVDDDQTETRRRSKKSHKRQYSTPKARGKEKEFNPGSSSSESDSTSSSEEDSYRQSKRRSTRHSRRSHSPSMPKLPTFNGEGNWDSFIYQFERIADRYDWSDRKCRERLLDCLKDRALEFAKEIRSREYGKLKKNMTRRFSKKEAPIAARRQLMYIRQKEGESIEEYSQRVQFLCMDGHPEAREETIDQIAVEAFLRGCRDKDAAKCAMEKNPKDIYKALKYVKASINNQQALFGSSNRSYSARQVTFAEGNNARNYSPSRAPQSLDDIHAQGGSRLPYHEEKSEVSQLLKAVTELVQKLDVRGGSYARSNSTSPNRMVRGRSPTPPQSPNRTRKLCYKCRKPGHFEANCPERNIEKQQSDSRRESLNENRLSLTAKTQSQN